MLLTKSHTFVRYVDLLLGSTHSLAFCVKPIQRTVGDFLPGRHDLAPYNYTVEVRNRFKGLYLIDIIPEEL